MEKDTKQFLEKGFKKTDAAIENLAAMTARGFEKVDKRFEKVDKRLDGIDGRLDGIDSRLDGIDVRLDRIENLLIRDNTNRIERLEDKIRIIETALGR
ncbi:MAG: hypothetical protein AAB773_01965 [Patescibacteria group bacterium]